MNLLRHLLSILALPTTVAVVVPYLLVSSPRFGALRWTAPPPLAAVSAAAGVLTIGAGLALVFVTVRHFATVGRGTLAPWDPPARLVVAGVYRHVRNPMITGVGLVLLGEALALRSPAVLAWGGVFALLNATYIPLVEERGLERRFGESYREYRRHVPRWIPRATPWGEDAPRRAA